MALQCIDDVFWILASGQPGFEDDRVLDDDLVLTRKVLHPAAKRIKPGVRGLVQRDGTLAGLSADLADHPPRQ